MTIARVGHSATLLDDGTVLIAGGRNLLGVTLASCEIYEPAQGTFSLITSMRVPRDDHSATLLPDGTVLIAGGESFGGKVLKSTEIYQPASRCFLSGPSMIHPRVNHTATALPDGTMLIAGGQSDDNDSLSQVKIYDLRNQTFTPAADMCTARANHTATLLGNGKVLIVGGESLQTRGSHSNLSREAESHPAPSAVPGAELYDIATRTFTPCSAQLSDRNFHTATLLPDGCVLIAGSVTIDGRVLEEAFTYDPEADAFRITATGMSHSRANHAAALITDDGVLLCGGFNASGLLRSAEQYDPETDGFAPAGEMVTERNFHTATLLKNGQVLIVGGENARGRALDSAELYRA